MKESTFEVPIFFFRRRHSKQSVLDQKFPRCQGSKLDSGVVKPVAKEPVFQVQAPKTRQHRQDKTSQGQPRQMAFSVVGLADRIEIRFQRRVKFFLFLSVLASCFHISIMHVWYSDTW